MAEKLSYLVTFFFRHLLQFKMLHFQTNMYGSHKSIDKYLEKYEKNYDLFIEVAQGIYGKLKTDKINIEFDTITDQSVDQAIDNYIEGLKAIENHYNNYSSLTTIADQMLADVLQLKYLLKFK